MVLQQHEHSFQPCPLTILYCLTGEFTPRWSGFILSSWERWQNQNPKHCDHEKKWWHGFHTSALQTHPFSPAIKLETAEVDIKLRRLYSCCSLRAFWSVRPQDAGRGLCDKSEGRRHDWETNAHANMVLYLWLVLQSEALGACRPCIELHGLEMFLLWLLEGATPARRCDSVRASGQGSWVRLHCWGR